MSTAADLSATIAADQLPRVFRVSVAALVALLGLAIAAVVWSMIAPAGQAGCISFGGIDDFSTTAPAGVWRAFNIVQYGAILTGPALMGLVIWLSAARRAVRGGGWRPGWGGWTAAGVIGYVAVAAAIVASVSSNYDNVVSWTILPWSLVVVLLWMAISGLWLVPLAGVVIITGLVTMAGVRDQRRLGGDAGYRNLMTSVCLAAFGALVTALTSYVLLSC